MGFLFPLFLIAGLSLAIPVLIHLFNLRRYKTVLFPHTRFLKNIQLRSRRQSEVRYKWLLALRLLFLASLILAFAQPLFHGNTGIKKGNNLQIIYLDNSASMSLKKGARSLLDMAREAARNQVQSAAPGARFLLLTNDKPISYQPLPADKVITAINSLDISAVSVTNTQTLATVQSLMQSEGTAGADLYYYSDFQRNAFAARPEAALLKGVTLHGITIQATTPANIFIDTAYLSSPVLQTGQNNQLIVRTRLEGKAPVHMPVLQLTVNGQVKSAASVSFNDKATSTDTLAFTVNDAGWQRITLAINDETLHFDDTFRISGRSTPSLSILVLNEGQPNPYIQAAFHSYSGFRLMQESVANAPVSWKDYNLVIFNGITGLDGALSRHLAEALLSGQSICIFPGKTRNVEGLNAALHDAGDIRFTGYDTSVQSAANLQQGSDLVKDLFEKIPENVQLPVANWHYIIQAGLTANQQSVLSFRNGDPFLARYSPSKGSLFICATSADLEGGNFPGSYFFVPFLYQMAMQSKGGDIYALTAGAQQAAFLPVHNVDERNMVHIFGDGMDAIPPQRAAGGGLEIFVDAAVQKPGFYRLEAPSGDSAIVAMNAGRSESLLEIWNMDALKKEWPGQHATWQSTGQTEGAEGAGQAGAFPLWKVCTILALLLLAAETILLAQSSRAKTVATT